MSVYLKIKTKILAEEAQSIRKEEKRLTKTARRKMARQAMEAAESGQIPNSPPNGVVNIRWTVQNLYTHRTTKVRNEARATFLARAFLAGKSRAEVEKTVMTDERLTFLRSTGIVDNVLRMVHEYNTWVYIIEKEDIIKWLESNEQL